MVNLIMKVMNKILVIGGAGFIGSHLVDKLLELNFEVKVLDNLTPQVHGLSSKKPNYLNKRAEFILGDIRDPDSIKKSLENVDIIFNLASAVSVSQSMYQIQKYIDINTRGTANLLDVIVNTENSVKKVILSSSVTIYGEGAYYCQKEKTKVFPKGRSIIDLKNHNWDPFCPSCGSILKSIPTNEDKPLDSQSIYALSKKHQEELTLLIGKTYGIPAVSLRFFNVYGPRQSISNPYAGVCQIFTVRLLNNNPPIIFEDGRQTRDFIDVRDVVDSLILSMKSSHADYNSYNVGSGKPTTVLDIANQLIKILNSKLKPEITNKYRKGDIRNCYADISKIKRDLNFKPEIKLHDGLEKLVDWIK
ncbi:MAG: SDR family NAD(P)-dependent oxidoreductase, partial [Candidatus Lokiarchaeota archaeon]|nr:SDR family NAD(P)-dependent oxidoreductase [Candidatus Lokiarchaeota archaeon]